LASLRIRWIKSVERKLGSTTTPPLAIVLTCWAVIQLGDDAVSGATNGAEAIILDVEDALEDRAKVLPPIASSNSNWKSQMNGRIFIIAILPTMNCSCGLLLLGVDGEEWCK